MVKVVNSLDAIETGYIVFERDQVLTHLQLNQLTRYLDDQDRLTRVSLVGVGLACGLRPSVDGDIVTVTKGVGVTTDGDLVRFGVDTLYDRFRPFDDPALEYAPFVPGGTRIRLWELVAVAHEAELPRTRPLSRFTADARAALADMVALLFVESHVHDPDLCSGADCDNLGQDAVNTTRLLLADAVSASRLLQAIPTASAAARRLPHVFVDRPAITTAITSLGALNAAYRPACIATLARLIDVGGTGAPGGLDRIYPECAPFLGDAFTEDPAGAWKKILNGLDGQFAPTAARGVQYYYDFLRDLVDTYNDFRAALFDDPSVCAPDFLSFPKHLVLGPLARTADPADLRTGFYPSPAVSDRVEWSRARFLARKLDTLIFNFELPGGPPALRITPSGFGDSPLEQRAIPYYYRASATPVVAAAWSHRLRRRGMEDHNYSYYSNRPALYAAEDEARDPLAADIARFPFYRVEGLLGANVKDAVAAVTNEIKARNLAIDVKAVLLDRDRTRLPFKPPKRYTDLHRLHYLLRQDIASQLDDVMTFSGKFKDKVDAGAETAVATNPAGVKQTAAGRASAVTDNAAKAKTTMAKSYVQYKADPSWKDTLRNTVHAAGTFKVDMGEIAKTDFATPFDTLIASPHLNWLDWLDDIIGKKDEKEEERVLFWKFLEEHPGLEHHAGTLRGGTFVLTYDTAGVVVADFMLPYICCERPEEEPEEPPLKPPITKPPYIVDHGIVIIPSPDRFFENFKKKIEPEWKGAIDLEKQYFTLFTNLVSGVPKAAQPATGGPGSVLVTDPKLDVHINETRKKAASVNHLRGEILKSSGDPAKVAALEVNLKEAEIDLAKTIAITADYVAKTPMEMGANSDGLTAMEVVSDAVNKITNTAALKEVKTGLEAAKEGAAEKNVGAGAAIGNILKGKGLVR